MAPAPLETPTVRPRLGGGTHVGRTLPPGSGALYCVERRLLVLEKSCLASTFHSARARRILEVSSAFTSGFYVSIDARCARMSPR